MTDAENPEVQIVELLDRAKQDADMPICDRTRVARMLLNHGHFLRTLPRLLEYHRGERTIYAKLTSKVSQLLTLCSPESDGRADWSEAFAKGRAGEVRRVLRDIEKLIKGE